MDAVLIFLILFYARRARRHLASRPSALRQRPGAFLACNSGRATPLVRPLLCWEIMA